MNQKRAGSEVRKRGGGLRESGCLWGGGVAWAIHFMVAWSIAEFGCLGETRETTDDRGVSILAWAILGVTMVCLALAAWATLASWRRARAAREAETGFVGRAGLIANPLFMFIILVQTVPVFFHLNDCVSPIQ